jgi:hypothetical protein
LAPEGLYRFNIVTGTTRDMKFDGRFTTAQSRNELVNDKLLAQFLFYFMMKSTVLKGKSRKRRSADKYLN